MGIQLKSRYLILVVHINTGQDVCCVSISLSLSLPQNFEKKFFKKLQWKRRPGS